MEEAQRKKNTGKVDIVNALVSASSDVHANVNEFFEWMNLNIWTFSEIIQ